jgi:hypothetical protein
LCDARDWGTIEIEFPKGSDDEDDSDILAVCAAAEAATCEGKTALELSVLARFYKDEFDTVKHRAEQAEAELAASNGGVER